jgi:hypothetical protein
MGPMVLLCCMHLDIAAAAYLSAQRAVGLALASHPNVVGAEAQVRVASLEKPLTEPVISRRYFEIHSSAEPLNTLILSDSR